MTIRLKDGGPAFPHVVRNDADDVTHGMSQRAYFAAHAPAAPEWFRLKTDNIPPKIPAVPDNWDTAERAEFAMIKEGTLQPAAACDDVQVFWNRFEPARARAEAWRDEMRQKKFFAWRWFYADMMLETEQG